MCDGKTVYSFRPHRKLVDVGAIVMREMVMSPRHHGARNRTKILGNRRIGDAFIVVSANHNRVERPNAFDHLIWIWTIAHDIAEANGLLPAALDNSEGRV